MSEITRDHLEGVHTASLACLWGVVDLVDAVAADGKVPREAALGVLTAMKRGQLGMNPERVHPATTDVQRLFAGALASRGVTEIAGVAGGSYHGAALNLAKLRVFDQIDPKVKAVEREVKRLSADQLCRIAENVGRLDRSEVEAGVPLVEREWMALDGGSADVSYHGDGLVTCGEASLRLEGQEATVLEALVETRAATVTMLRDRSGYHDAPRILKAIKAKFPILDPVITLPGGKGRGGYRTTIEDARG